MAVGIEKLSFYAGHCCLDLRDLAAARGVDPDYISRELMCERRSVLPPYEDAVTLAVNAAMKILTEEDRQAVELLIVATESGIDFGKPISTWVHRFCNLPANCRNFEVKHACYGCTGGFKMAASWLASAARSGKKALVINTDLSRCGIGTKIEPLGGACAIAMLISHCPNLLEVVPGDAGYWTRETADNMRPTAMVEIVADYLSIFSYLDALDGAYEHFEAVVGRMDYDRRFKRHIYHAPFPAMTLQAHKAMLNRSGVTDRTQVQESFERKVEPGLRFAKQIGSSYGGSNYLSLLGLVRSGGLATGDPISLFSYGGGCQAEFYGGILGPGALDQEPLAALERELEERIALSVCDYECLEQQREHHADAEHYEASREGLNGAFEQRYQGRHLLLLKGVSQYIRHYEWS